MDTEDKVEKVGEENFEEDDIILTDKNRTSSKPTIIVDRYTGVEDENWLKNRETLAEDLQYEH